MNASTYICFHLLIELCNKAPSLCISVENHYLDDFNLAGTELVHQQWFSTAYSLPAL